MKKLIQKILAILLLAAPLSGYAHPGHGQENPWSPLHYLTHPQHMLVVYMLIGVGATWAAWFLWKKWYSNKQ